MSELVRASRGSNRSAERGRPVARGETSPVDRELIAQLAEVGISVSAAQLERWRAFGLLEPHPRQYLGRGRGSVAVLPEGATRNTAAVARRSVGTRPLAEIALRVLFEELLPRFESVRVVEHVEWTRSNRHTGLRHLMVELG